MKKKQSYLLLELLISLSILTLCLGPLLSSPFTCLKKQKKDLLSLRLQKKGEELLYFVEERLRQGLISWDTLEKSHKEQVILETPKLLDTKRDLDTIKTTIFLKGGGLGQDKENNQIRTVHVHIDFYAPHEKTKIYATSAVLFCCKKNPYASATPIHSPKRNP